MTFAEGDRIIFYPGGNPPGRKGRFIHPVKGHEGIVLLRLDTDPYDVCVTSEYVHPSKDHKTHTDKEMHNMATATKSKPKAKDLRRDAKALGVEGWEDMDLDELIEAVDEAKAAEEKAASKKSKKATKAAPKRAAVEDDEDDEDEDDDEDDDEDEAPAKSKKSSKKAAPAKAAKSSKKAEKPATKKAKAKDEDDDLPENGNPFTEGTNLYYMTEELIKGGKRSAMVKRLGKKISLKPRTRSFTEEEELAEIDRRLVIVSQTLRNNHGFKMEREGRGPDTVIRLYK